MKMFGRIVLIITLLITASSRDALGQKASSIEIERGHSILRALKSDIEQNYYDPKFRGIDIETLFKDAKEKIKQADSNGQIFGIIARVLIEFNDSHLFFIPPPRPVRIEYGWFAQMIGDKCFVSGVKPGSDAEAQGLKEGDLIYLYDGMKPNRKEFWKIGYILNVLRPKTSLRVVVQSAGAEPRELEIKAKVTELKRLTDLTSGNEIMRLEVEEERNARLTRHRFTEIDDVFIWKMPQFDLTKVGVDDMAGKFRKKKALVLDLRGNGGGYEETLLRLLGWFSSTEIKIGDLVRRKESKPLIAKSVEGDGAFKGKLVVLIDSNSGSAAELFARVVQIEKRGTVIGDQSAGAVMRSRRYDHQFGMGTVTFYGVSVTDADFIMTDGKGLESVGVTPDELLLPEQLDLANGRDPVLARALALVGLDVSPEKAHALFPKEWRK